MQIRFSDHRFTLLLAALLLLMVLSPTAHVLRVAGYGNVGAAVNMLLFAGVLLAAIPAISRTRRTVAIAVILVGTSLVLRTVGLFLQNSVVQFAYLLAGILFLLIAAVLIARFLFETHRVTLNTVNASLCIYMLLGVLWAKVYSLLDLLEPDAFLFPARGGSDIGLAGTSAERALDLLYYSFTTLTTLGYGDITPASAFARMFSVTEAVMGQVILVVLVAHLVGLRTAQSIESTKDRAP